MPCSQTPVGPLRQTIGLRPTFVRSDIAFRSQDSVGSDYVLLSWLHHTACTLAVYAS